MMIKDVTIISKLSKINTAPANRLFCIVKGFEGNGVKVTLINLCHISHMQITPCNIIELSKARNKYIYLAESIIKSRRIINKSHVLWLYLSNGLIINYYLNICAKSTFLIFERSEYPEYSGKWQRDTKLFSRFNLLITISETLRDYYVKLGFPHNDTYVLPMLIDTTRFDNIQKDPTCEQYIAYCGEMAGNKDGLLDLISAFEIFSRDNDSIKLYLIGDSRNLDDLNKLKQNVSALKLSNKVVFTGRVDRTVMPKYLVNAQCLVLARPNNRQAQGGFPTKLGEYLVTGNPVVITRTGEIDRFLSDNIDCFFVEPNNPIAFADKLDYVFNNLQYAKQVGKNGQKKAYDVFNYKIQISKLIGFISKKLDDE